MYYDFRHTFIIIVVLFAPKYNTVHMYINAI